MDLPDENVPKLVSESSSPFFPEHLGSEVPTSELYETGPELQKIKNSDYAVADSVDSWLSRLKHATTWSPYYRADWTTPTPRWPFRTTKQSLGLFEGNIDMNSTEFRKMIEGLKPGVEDDSGEF